MLVIVGMNICELGTHKDTLKPTVPVRKVRRRRKRKLIRKSKLFGICEILAFIYCLVLFLGTTKTAKTIISLFKKENKMKCALILSLLSSLNKVLYALMRFFALINNVY